MPAPTNISAATAIELGPLSRVVTQNVNDSGTTYTVWYKYAPQVGDTAIGIFALGDATGAVYRPRITVYQADGVTVLLPGFADGYFVTNTPIIVPVDGQSVIYFEIASQTGNVSPAVLTLTATASPVLAASIGDLLINDDTPGFIAAILDQTTGAVQRFADLVAGEHGALLPSGALALYNDAALSPDPKAISLYDAALGFITSVLTNNAAQSYAIASDATQFYFVEQPDFVSTVVKTLSPLGVVGGSPWTIAHPMAAVAVNLAGTILYHNNTQNGEAIHRYDLVNRVDLSDLAAAPDGSHASAKDILRLADDTILVCWCNPGVDYVAKRYSTAGAVLNTFTVTVSGALTDGPRLSVGGDDPASFWVWTTGTPVFGNFQSVFQRVKISDGSTIATFSPYVFEAGIGPSLDSGWPTFGPSKSCPILAMRTAIGAVGTIVVQKITNEGGACETAFPFVATGLSPASFTLADGESRSFSVSPGSGFGLSETTPSGWRVDYHVSNGSPIDNLSVAAGETVIVTVTNTPLPPSTSCWTGDDQPFVSCVAANPGPTEAACWHPFTVDDLKIGLKDA